MYRNEPIPLATPLPATGYQPGIALSRSISLGPMETFLLTLSVGGIESLRAWLARRKLVSRRPRRSEADSRYPEATLARISRTCTKQISKFMTANTEEEKHTFCLHWAPTVSRSRDFNQTTTANHRLGKGGRFLPRFS